MPLVDSTDNDPIENTSSTRKIFQSFVSEVRLNYKTIVNALVNACGSLISTTYWIAQMTDVAVDLDGDGQDEFFADMSAVGLPVGLVLAIFITVGSVYAHYILNTNSTYAIKNRSYSLPDNNDSEIDTRIALTTVQKILLTLDFFSHAADGAGPALFIYSLSIDDPSRTSKIQAQLIASFIGGIAAFADATTCGHNMRLHNRNVLMDSQKPIEAPAYLHAEFFAHEMRKLNHFFTASDPHAAKLFANTAMLLEEGALALTIQARMVAQLHRPTIEVLTDNGEVDAEYHALNDQEDGSELTPMLRH